MEEKLQRIRAAARTLAELLRGHYVQCDETPVKFIDPDEKSCGTVPGYLWVVSAPSGDVVFDWRLNRRMVN